jgi:uncharacterized protein (DUF302 family)
MREISSIRAVRVVAAILLSAAAGGATAGGDAAPVGAPAGQGLILSTAPVRIARIQVRDGVSFDDAVESLRLRANQRNLKFVGVNHLGKEIEALSGRPSRRIEIFGFCDGLAAQQMIEADASMLAYMPCRIGMLEDAQGRIWVISMLIDDSVLGALPSPARESAKRVTAALQEIMVAAAQGDL